MTPTIPPADGVLHAVLPDIGRPVMAKADVRGPDVSWMVKIGGAIQDAVRAARWSNKEAAGKAHVDDAEFGKWVSGARRPHLDRLLAVPELRAPLIIALALLDGEGVEVTTTITLRRTA